VKFLKKLPLSVILLLPWLLSGCAVYDSVFHPHRLGTPKMDATAKAKARAAEKARHKGTSLKAADATETNATSTDGGGEPGAPSGSTDKKKTMSYSELPEGTRIKYDKQGLVKKGKLDRMAINGRKLHHYDTRPLTPREASTENRKLRKKGHTDHGKDAPRSKEKAERLDPALDTGPDPGPPAAEPTTPTEPQPKAKSSKQVAPKPDPTEPEPEPAPAPKKKKDKKAPVPKPDPTQPAPGE
jgi:hypothetical protein